MDTVTTQHTTELSNFHRLHPVPYHLRCHILHSHVQSLPLAPATPHSNPPSRHGNNEATRVYGFDLNPHWQEDRDHYDNQKVNGLTLPRSIRQSAFTQKLDIEGCDPLALPVAALLYQQAKNHWLRKLAYGREVYLIPWRISSCCIHH